MRRTRRYLVPWLCFVFVGEFMWQMWQYENASGNDDDTSSDTGEIDDTVDWHRGKVALVLIWEFTYVGALILFYGTLLFLDAHWIYRRPALDWRFTLWQCVTMVLLAVNTVVGTGLVSVYGKKDILCMTESIAISILSYFVGPLVIFHTLQRDSE